MKKEDRAKIVSKYSNQILELITNQLKNDDESLTWGDVDGVAMAIVMNVILEVEK